MDCKYNECNGTGFLPIILENGEQEFKPCRCRLDKASQDSLRRKLIEANIPTNYWEYTFDNYLSLSRSFPPEVKEFNRPHVELLQEYVHNPVKFITGKQVLWLWGPHDNSCHTTLAVILGTELIKANYKVFFTTFSKLLGRFVDFDNKEKNEKELKGKDVYIIDDAFDMSRCSPGAYRQGQLFSFLDEALSNSKHIICTSNGPASNIGEAFSQSRIILTRSIKVMELHGDIGGYLNRLRS